MKSSHLLTFPKVSLQNMHGFGHATILILSFHGLCLERLGPQPPFCVLNTSKNHLQIMSFAAYASETNEIRDFLNKSIEDEVIYLLHKQKGIFIFH